MYGSPTESRNSVRTVTLDLPAEVGSVYDPDGDRPPVEAYGPLEQGEDISGVEPRLPSTKEVDGSVVKFTFDEPLGHGAWKVVVYQSRIRRKDNGEGFELTDDNGDPWNSWVLQVLDAGPARSAPDPGTREGKPQPKTPATAVYLDGEKTPNGASELSGEVLRADVYRPGTVEMEVDPLLDGTRTTLYELYRAEMLSDEEKEQPHDKRTFRYASVGPVQSFKWAQYKGTSTLGRLQLGDNKNMAYGTAVIRKPQHPDVDPLLSETTGTESPTNSHPNTYKTRTYTATPQDPDVGIDEYNSPKLLAPETINDDTNTPATNPRLYPEGVYFPDLDQPPPGRAAVFDLPINSTLRLRVGGQVCWWGQTRLVPTLVSPRTAAREIPAAEASTREDRARLQRKIWRASMEAVRLWGDPLPTDQDGNGIVVSTMRDYVLTSVAAGSEYEEGTQGEVRGSQGQGQHQFAAQSDRTLRRRKHRLAEMLQDQKRNAPPMPEDHAPGVAAEVGSNADRASYGRTAHQISENFAQIYDPTRVNQISFEHHRRDLRFGS